MKRFKTFILEGTQTGDVWEYLIAAGWNHKVWSASEAKRKVAVTDVLSGSAPAAKLWVDKDVKANAVGIAKSASKKLSGANKYPMIQYGKGKGKLSSLWMENKAGNPTPKTDNYIGEGESASYTLSLKKGTGSQLGSPMENETRATFKAALRLMEINYKNKLAPELKTAITSMIQKDSEEWAEAFKKRQFSTDVTDLNIIAHQALEKLHGGALKNKGRVTLDDMFSDKGEFSDEKWQQSISQGASNQIAIRATAHNAHTSINKTIAEVFSNHPEFKLCCVAETATGYNKFTSGDIAVAEYLFKFDETSPGKTFIDKMLLDKKGHFDKKIIQDIAQGLGTIEVSFKPTGRSSPAIDAVKGWLRDYLTDKKAQKINYRDEQKRVKEEIKKFESSINLAIKGSEKDPKLPGLRNLASGLYRGLYSQAFQEYTLAKKKKAKKKIKFSGQNPAIASTATDKLITMIVTNEKIEFDIPIPGKKDAYYPNTKGKTFLELAQKHHHCLVQKDCPLTLRKVSNTFWSKAGGKKGWLVVAVKSIVQKKLVAPALRWKSKGKRKTVSDSVEYPTFSTLVEGVIAKEHQQFMLIEGLWDDIKGLAQRAVNWVKETVKKVWNKVLDTVDAVSYTHLTLPTNREV